MLDAYRLIQFYDDGDDQYPFDEISVYAEGPDDARAVAVQEDDEYPRNVGWADADVILTGWGTANAVRGLV